MPIDQPSPPGPQAPGKQRGGRNLPVAIASGLFLGAVFIGTTVWSPWAILTFIGVLLLLAVLELDKAFRLQGWRPATPVVIGSGVVTLYGAYTHGAVAQTLGLVLLMLGSGAWVLLDVQRKNAVASIAASCLMGLWVPFLASFIGLLAQREHYSWIVIAAIALPVTADIAAYAVGSLLGRHKLAPSVSPGKTWEGFIGAVIGTTVIGALVMSRFPGLDMTSALLLGAAAAVAGTLGDLAESLVKRDLGLKDLGGIIPGHGGIMERADGVLFTLPVVHLILLALGR